MKKLIVVLLMLSLVLSGCSKSGGADSNNDAEEAVSEQILYVKTEKPYNKTFKEKVVLPGTLTPKEEGIITAKVSGVIDDVNSDLGDMVSTNDILCEIEPEVFEGAYNKAKLDYDSISTKYNRMVELYENGAVSKASFEDIEKQYHSSKEDYELAKLNLEYSRIKSPINGMISSKKVLIGQGVSTGMELFRVVDISQLYVDTGITEKDIDKLKEGQEVNVITASDAVFKGQVHVIGPVPDSQTGTYPIKVLVDNSDKSLKAGMFVDIEIIISTNENALAIDKNAVITEDGMNYVFVVEDGVAHKKNLSIGITDEDSVEIIDGITQSEDVVTVGQNKLRDQSVVEIGE